MSDELAFVERLEHAQPDELRRILVAATPAEEDLLGTYLGEERYRRMRARALRQSSTRGLTPTRGNVVVLHGIMGAELTAARTLAVGGAGPSWKVWLNYLRLIFGDVRHLALDPSGTAELDPAVAIRASGILKRPYGEMLLALSERWETRAFWYDWRKDLHAAAKELHLKLIEWFEGEPVHLVAHSMGGVVARAFIADYPAHWEDLRDEEGDGARGGRLVMLGTPNHGAYVVPQIVTGVEGVVRNLARGDLSHSLDEVLDVINTFPGSYQLLPSPFAAATEAAKAETLKLYAAATYGRGGIPQAHLDAALAFHEHLRDADTVDTERMVYVAGFDQPTYSAITHWGDFKSRDLGTARGAYAVTLAGDGRVTHALGRLEKGGVEVPTYYVKEKHGDLPENPRVLDALDALLTRGDPGGLLRQLPPSERRGPEAEQNEARSRMNEAEAERDEDGARIAAYLSARQRRTRAPEPGAPPIVTADDRLAEEMLTRGFLSAPYLPRPTASREQAERPTLYARVAFQDIRDKVKASPWKDGVDALGVGHYRGVRPTNAVGALDEALSRAGLGEKAHDRGERLLAQLVERGTIRGDLAQPFFLADPRDPRNNVVVAIAGMGDPGRFGPPELTVLVRELVWALGRLGKRHLAAVLIGSGEGNVGVRESVRAWLRGFAQALSGVPEEEQEPGLRHLTLIEHDPGRAREIDRALADEADRPDGPVVLEHVALSPAELGVMKRALRVRRERALEDELDRFDRESTAGASSAAASPTRLTVELERETYRFGALTADAAVPERAVQVAPLLITEANDLLVSEWEQERQHEHGLTLGGLLVPRDLRDHLAGSAPLVLLLDATTARIHWEMVATPDAPGQARVPGASARPAFLGLGRGLTRQLRTQFAPPPEPPPPPRRVLRVLVVADPAADAPLKGAQEEGAEVADLFEAYNRLHPDGPHHIEVVRLSGPRAATPLRVIGELMRRPYDVLHFAGHCVYDATNPAASGWIFSNGFCLTARELTRIDRVPAFVFSNACESGVTPDRSTPRSDALAPSFAEAFFRQGVTNFVCTAWPIDDGAARQFAAVLYERLLGLRRDERVEAPTGAYATADPAPMHEAMRAAREEVYEQANGYRTWGAYQHYGNPYFRLFLGTSDAGGDSGGGGHTARAASAPDAAPDPAGGQEEEPRGRSGPGRRRKTAAPSEEA